MIKAIILDVDGVMVGNKAGINFPLPHQDVIQEFKKIRAGGIPIILCTAKFNFAILEIIKQAKLNNPHITDGGALILDPLDKKIIKKHILDKKVVKEYINSSLEKDIYIEIYTPEAYFLQKTQIFEFTAKRTSILQMKPIIIDSLFSIAEKQDIIKIINFTQDENDKAKIEAVAKEFKDKINLLWSFHPYLHPARPCIITAANVSKAHAAKETIKSLGLSFDEVLGVGDTAGDWNFMQLCNYVATLENGDEEIKKLVKTKGQGNYFIAPHIDANGILDILKYFSQI